MVAEKAPAMALVPAEEEADWTLKEVVGAAMRGGWAGAAAAVMVALAMEVAAAGSAAAGWGSQATGRRQAGEASARPRKGRWRQDG